MSENGQQVEPDKIKAVLQFPTPKNQTQVKSFLGLASHYRRYLQGFHSIARPLHKASETSSAFQWNDEDQHALHFLKTSLTTTLILALPSLQKPFILYKDASHFAMGAVLPQENDGCESYAMRPRRYQNPNAGIPQHAANFWQLWRLQDISNITCSDVAPQQLQAIAHSDGCTASRTQMG